MELEPYSDMHCCFHQIKNVLVRRTAKPVECGSSAGKQREEGEGDQRQVGQPWKLVLEENLPALERYPCNVE